MKLTETDKQSLTWVKIEREITERLTIARAKNDGDLTAQETDRLRGTIAAYKEVLGWAIPNPTFDNGD
jgi:hypothetical protein